MLVKTKEKAPAPPNVDQAIEAVQQELGALMPQLEIADEAVRESYVELAFAEQKGGSTSRLRAALTAATEQKLPLLDRRKELDLQLDELITRREALRKKVRQHRGEITAQ